MHLSGLIFSSDFLLNRKLLKIDMPTIVIRSPLGYSSHSITEIWQNCSFSSSSGSFRPSTKESRPRIDVFISTSRWLLLRCYEAKSDHELLRNNFYTSENITLLTAFLYGYKRSLVLLAVVEELGLLMQNGVPMQHLLWVWQFYFLQSALHFIHMKTFTLQLRGKCWWKNNRKTWNKFCNLTLVTLKKKMNHCNG